MRKFKSEIGRAAWERAQENRRRHAEERREEREGTRKFTALELLQILVEATLDRPAGIDGGSR